MRILRAAVSAALIVAVALVAPAAGAIAKEQPRAKAAIVRIWHPAVTPTGVIGSGLGTVRTWFTPTTVDGVSAPGQYMTGTLTTVAIDASDGTEWRTSNLVFVVGGESNQLVVGGVSLYPATSATIATGTQTIRPIIGGSGAYNGARGYVVTTNLGPRGWLHVFHVLR